MGKVLHQMCVDQATYLHVRLFMKRSTVEVNVFLYCSLDGGMKKQSNSI